MEIGVSVPPDAKPDTTRDYAPSEVADLIFHKIPRKQWADYPPGFVKRLLAVEQWSAGAPGRRS